MPDVPDTDVRRYSRRFRCWAAVMAAQAVDMMPARAVVFDFGGVVCDFLPERRLQALTDACGLPAERIHALLWETSFARDCDLGRYRAQEAYAYVRSATGFAGSYDDLLRVWAEGFVLRPQVLRVVQQARSEARTALFTNNCPLLLDAFPTYFKDVTAHFDQLIFSCGLGCMKPDPEAFRKATEILGCAPAEVLFVDDSAANVRAAAEHGWHGVLFTGVAELERALAPLLLPLLP